MKDGKLIWEKRTMGCVGGCRLRPSSTPSNQLCALLSNRSGARGGARGGRLARPGCAWRFALLHVEAQMSSDLTTPGVPALSSVVDEMHAADAASVMNLAPSVPVAASPCVVALATAIISPSHGEYLFVHHEMAPSEFHRLRVAYACRSRRANAARAQRTIYVSHTRSG